MYPGEGNGSGWTGRFGVVHGLQLRWQSGVGGSISRLCWLCSRLRLLVDWAVLLLLVHVGVRGTLLPFAYGPQYRGCSESLPRRSCLSDFAIVVLFELKVGHVVPAL